MAEFRKGASSMHTQTTAQPVEPIFGREIEMPPGWKYKSLKLGPATLPWYASPESQLILVSFVCFLCPGMFNALNGLGGAGQLDKDAYASDASNCALYATFAVVGSYLCFNYTRNFGYVVFAGVLLGCCAGILWAAQGAIMMSYPPEKLKGRYISWFWLIFNLGAVIGSVVTLGLNIDNTGNDGKPIGNSTYIGFLILTFLGACLSWTLVDAKHVVRRDGSRIILMKHPTWKTEILGLWETLWTDPYIILLFPMFFASNWFYTYQFQDVNLARFNVRTRALNNTLYWVAQMIGALVFGFALDFPNIRRTSRAKFAWVAMFALTFGIWGGGYVFQRQYSRNNLGDQYDWTSDGFLGPMFLYIFYGFYDAAWQTCVYWFMGAISNNGRKLANFAGFYKGIQSAGAAIIWRLNGMKKPYMNMFASCWILLAGSLVIALPVMILKIKDTVPVEEDLKFVDEDDIIGSKHIYEKSEPERV
ncbi:MFS general substrate transporter [Lentithecium fluviatile CBS 122367]|uniref:MFS general substrate transporter n=1 Tax=Lentithecium fluviatile CBS 122367 TaxID=1168545 RepID=A0A6G1IRW7_9PLEO|nr:MFS general substrate transporter [Lentithecium fluviatile CBS 122367]